MLRQFLTMHHSERRILSVLLVAGVLALLAISLLGSGSDNDAGTAADKEAAARAASARKGGGAMDSYNDRTAETAPRLTAFDPNTADSAQLLSLGLPPFVVRNIYKYRSMGGVFSEREDFAQLYGLTVKKYKELEPYIKISSEYRPASTLFASRERPQRTGLRPATAADSAAVVYRHSTKLSAGETIDLSLADTTALKTVPGIGSYYARRIVEYGRRLGGYVSVDQLDEIEDFPQDAKKYIRLGKPSVKKLNVNNLQMGELRKHPYVNFYMARAITEYRRRQGRIESLDDLRLLPEFTDAALARLQPYVEF